MTVIHRNSGPAKIALLHHAGGGNLGDDAIIESVLNNIRQRWPDANIVAISMNPQDTERRHKIPSYPIRRHTWELGYKPKGLVIGAVNRHGLAHWVRTTRAPFIRVPRAVFNELAFLLTSWKRIKSFDLMVLGGGGQLTDRSGPWSFPYAIFAWFLLAKAARLKRVVLNTGAGPLIHPVTKFFIARALKAANYVSFRDKESQVLARNIGFRGASDVFPDNVYALELSQVHRCRARRPASKVVGIAPMMYPTDPPFDARESKLMYAELIGKLANFASVLWRTSYRFEIFGTDIGVDPFAIADLRLKLSEDYNLATPPYEPIESLNNLLFRMSSFDYVVTCRFHGVVIAHLLNKPVLAIAHHPKVTHLMNALGLSKYCVDIRSFNPDLLIDTFNRLVDNRDEVKNRLASTLKLYKSRLATQFDNLWPAEVTEPTCHVGSR